MARASLQDSELLAPQAICLDVLLQRYLQPGERGAQDVFQRVARALASVEAASERVRYEALFLDNLRAGALGAGRIMHGAGTALGHTLINCFVQPVGDALQGVDAAEYPCVEVALREALQTLRCGGGVGCDFSRLRPRAAQPYASGGAPPGPCACIDLFDRSCATLETQGGRRAAQMGVLRADHPDVLDFIEAKRTPGRWSTFNLSVGVQDAFMRAVVEDQPWALVHPVRPASAGEAPSALERADGRFVYRVLPARELWDRLVRSAYDHGEPGMLFLDRINQDNNLRCGEHIEATNPCGEQPLPPYGSCDLGPLILPRFVLHPFGIGGSPELDFGAFRKAVQIQVRALDNVIDLTAWPLPQQRLEAQAKRRIGVGLTGLGDALAMLGLRYDRQEGRDMAACVARCMRDAAYAASVALAREKGAFPRFDAGKYLAPDNFASRLPEALQEAIREHGIRNSHLLSIAPTGSVSLAFADNTSNGIEPPFDWCYRRTLRDAAGGKLDCGVEDAAWRQYRALGGDVERLPAYFVSAQSMSARDHIAMVEAVQPFVDAGISKTVNVPVDLPYEAFRDLYLQAWSGCLKGITTYRPNPIRGAVLRAHAQAVGEAQKHAI